MIHHTMGVYANGDRKHNGVPSENLALHIAYNVRLRFGRALFVDGICIHTGYLSREEADAIETELAQKPIRMDRDTQPYQ